MWMTAYFLSKFAEAAGSPPVELGTTKWKDAYRMFYEKLGAGRTVDSFGNSLNNARDAFDSHLDSKRVGWLTEDGQPNKLNQVARSIYSSFSKISRQEIWEQIMPFVKSDIKTYGQVIDDLSSIQQMEDEREYRSKTEGGIKVIISVRYERNITLRKEAFKIHGYDCAVCGFNFGKVYGDWGKDFGEVHHLIPLSELEGNKRKVNPRTDLIVLCSNCHRMIHRKNRITLTIDELKAKVLTDHLTGML
jgi:5-methylcytosine-specific restriction protein A